MSEEAFKKELKDFSTSKETALTGGCSRYERECLQAAQFT
jgi:hypothetical protein